MAAVPSGGPGADGFSGAAVARMLIADGSCQAKGEAPTRSIQGATTNHAPLYGLLLKMIR